jgi:lysophospholipase L1-like esterase
MNLQKYLYLLLLFLFVGVITAHAQIPSCSAASQFYSKDSINLTTFGASTVHGMYGHSFQPYLQENLERCYTGKVVTITNDGIPGETTTEGLKRFPAAIAHRTGFMLIQMGANDVMAMANKKMKVSETEKNMKYYLQTSIKSGLIPIVGTLQFFNDKNDRYFKTCNLYVKQVNALYKKLASEYHAYVADINKGLGRDFGLYADFIHPNEAGYRLISCIWFDAVNQAIEDKLLLVGLNQNYPNPVRANAKIGFSLAQEGKVIIQLYNMNGAMVRTLYDEYQGAGYHEIPFSVSGLSPGIYVYIMQVGGQRLSKKMLIAR